MLSTPLPNTSYKDDPGLMMKMILALTPEETRLFARGYIQACDHVLEGFSMDKTDFLNVMLVADEPTKTLLGCFVDLLDSYTEQLEMRCSVVTTLFESRETP